MPPGFVRRPSIASACGALQSLPRGMAASAGGRQAGLDTGKSMLPWGRKKEAAAARGRCLPVSHRRRREKTSCEPDGRGAPCACSCARNQAREPRCRETRAAGRAHARARDTRETGRGLPAAGRAGRGRTGRRDPCRRRDAGEAGRTIRNAASRAQSGARNARSRARTRYARNRARLPGGGECRTKTDREEGPLPKTRCRGGRPDDPERPPDMAAVCPRRL